MFRTLHRHIFAISFALLPLLVMVRALGSTCSTPLGGGTAGSSDAFWMQNMKHQGIAAFNSVSAATLLSGIEI